MLIDNPYFAIEWRENRGLEPIKPFTADCPPGLFVYSVLARLEFNESVIDLAMELARGFDRNMGSTCSSNHYGPDALGRFAHALEHIAVHEAVMVIGGVTPAPPGTTLGRTVQITNSESETKPLEIFWFNNNYITQETSKLAVSSAGSLLHGIIKLRS